MVPSGVGLVDIVSDMDVDTTNARRTPFEYSAEFQVVVASALLDCEVARDSTAIEGQSGAGISLPRGRRVGDRVCDAKLIRLRPQRQAPERRLPNFRNSVKSVPVL